MSLSRLTNHDPGAAGAAASASPSEASFLVDALEEDWERLARYCVRRRFRAGEELVHQGEVDRSMLILTAGTLEVLVTDADGRGRVLETLVAPSMVGEVSFFDGLPRSGTLRARTAGDLLRLSFTQFEALAAASPALARTILLDAGRIIAFRLRRATSLLVDS